MGSLVEMGGIVFVPLSNLPLVLDARFPVHSPWIFRANSSTITAASIFSAWSPTAARLCVWRLNYYQFLQHISCIFTKQHSSKHNKCKVSTFPSKNIGMNPNKSERFITNMIGNTVSSSASREHGRVDENDFKTNSLLYSIRMTLLLIVHKTTAERVQRPQIQAGCWMNWSTDTFYVGYFWSYW